MSGLFKCASVSTCLNSDLKCHLKEQQIKPVKPNISSPSQIQLTKCASIPALWEVIIALMLSVDVCSMLNNLFRFCTGVPSGGIRESQLGPSRPTCVRLNISAASVALLKLTQQVHYSKILIINSLILCCVLLLRNKLGGAETTLDRIQKYLNRNMSAE